MALFKKRLSLDEILKAVSALSPEDKEKVRAAAESEAPVEEPPAENKATEGTPEVPAGEPADEPEGEAPGTASGDSTETADPAAETDDANATAAEEADESEAVSADAETDVDGTPNETVQDEEADEHGAEIIKALTDRVIALEDGMKTLKALQERMEEYDARNAENFGYLGKPGDKQQDIAEMSASELKEKMLSGQH